MLIATSVSMVFGELVPKNLAVASRCRPRVGRGRSAADVLDAVHPLIQLTNGTANWILRRLGIEPAEELRSARSPQELVSLVRTSARSGSLDPVTAVLVDRSLQFGVRTAEELMTPRSKIDTLDADDTVADLGAAAVRTGHSRFPIIRGDLDETIGIVHVKQVFAVPPAERARRPGWPIWRSPSPRCPRPSTVTPSCPSSRANGLQTALVVDEYGGTAGMVTVEDLIEEIVGDMRDEHDEATARRRPGRQRLAGLGTAAHRRGGRGNRFRAPEGDYETIGGLVLEKLGHIPEEGETVELTAFDPDGPIEDPVRWRRRGQDGRPPDRSARADRTGRGAVDAREQETLMGGDIFGVAADRVLLAANAFFVGVGVRADLGAPRPARSARRTGQEERGDRDPGRREPVADAGRAPNSASRSARSCWAGSASPPSRTCWRSRSTWSASPMRVLHTVSFLVALPIVVTLHVLLGEMVPKNIAIAGPESTAMLLIPSYLVYMRAARPFIAFYNWCANVTLRAFGVEPKDELEITVSTVELSEMIAESLSEGLLDPEDTPGSPGRCRSAPASSATSPFRCIRSARCRWPARSRTDGRCHREALTETGYSRFPVADPAASTSATCTSRTSCRWSTARETRCCERR